jgi:D-alanyl-D-alanine carboxypeptidase
MMNKRKAVKSYGRTGLIYLALFVLLGVVVYFCCREISAYETDDKSPVSDSPVTRTGENGYMLKTMDTSAYLTGELVLVNGGHPYSPSDGPELVGVYDNKNACYFVRDKTVQVAREAMEPLNALMEAFYEAKDIDDVNVVSGYRTYDEQQGLYTSSVEEKGEAYTAMFVAEPGFSEHHTGLALDLSIYHIDTGTSESFDGGGPYGWITDNCWRYGFILRYPESKSAITNVGSEPWHFRYVGIPHACYMKEHDQCLEEYIDLLYQYPYDGEHLTVECLGKRYEVYYCAGTGVYIPEQGDYTVSGNNIDGFIVTAVLSS